MLGILIRTTLVVDFQSCALVLTTSAVGRRVPLSKRGATMAYARDGLPRTPAVRRRSVTSDRANNIVQRGAPPRSRPGPRWRREGVQTVFAERRPGPTLILARGGASQPSWLSSVRATPPHLRYAASHTVCADRRFILRLLCTVTGSPQSVFASRAVSYTHLTLPTKA